jgi:hypothetical protein
MDSEPGTGGDKKMGSTKLSKIFKFDGRLDTWHVVLFLGGGAALVCVVFLAALMIPDDKKKCALMPGFCKPKVTASKKGSFDGAMPSADAAPFSLSE